MTDETIEIDDETALQPSTEGPTEPAADQEGERQQDLVLVA